MSAIADIHPGGLGNSPGGFHREKSRFTVPTRNKKSAIAAFLNSPPPARRAPPDRRLVTSDEKTSCAPEPGCGNVRGMIEKQSVECHRESPVRALVTKWRNAAKALRQTPNPKRFTDPEWFTMLTREAAVLDNCAAELDECQALCLNPRWFVPRSDFEQVDAALKTAYWLIIRHHDVTSRPKEWGKSCPVCCRTSEVSPELDQIYAALNLYK